MVTINIGRKEAVFFLVFVLIAFSAFVVVAYNSGSTPDVMGHDGGEVEVTYWDFGTGATEVGTIDEALSNWGSIIRTIDAWMHSVSNMVSRSDQLIDIEGLGVVGGESIWIVGHDCDQNNGDCSQSLGGNKGAAAAVCHAWEIVQGANNYVAIDVDCVFGVENYMAHHMGHSLSGSDNLAFCADDGTDKADVLVTCVKTGFW